MTYKKEQILPRSQGTISTMIRAGPSMRPRHQSSLSLEVLTVSLSLEIDDLGLVMGNEGCRVRKGQVCRSSRGRGYLRGCALVRSRRRRTCCRNEQA